MPVSAVDIHCHALFGIDDGARNIEESITILRSEYSTGVKKICLTPHFKPELIRSPESYLAKYDEAFKALSARAADEMPDLVLCRGNEIMYHTDCVENLDRGLCRTLGDGNYVLIEFMPGVSFSAMREGLRRVASGGYRPVLAHAERYAALAADKRKADKLFDDGVLLTVNHTALTGGHGLFVQLRVLSMLRHDLISAITTDAHRADGKSARLGACYAYLSRHFGIDFATDLLGLFPDAILAGRNI